MSHGRDRAFCYIRAVAWTTLHALFQCMQLSTDTEDIITSPSCMLNYVLNVDLVQQQKKKKHLQRQH